MLSLPQWPRFSGCIEIIQGSFDNYRCPNYHFQDLDSEKFEGDSNVQPTLKPSMAKATMASLGAFNLSCSPCTNYSCQSHSFYL